MKPRASLLWAGSGVLGLAMLMGLLSLAASRGLYRPALGQNTTLPRGGAPTALPPGGEPTTLPSSGSLSTLPRGGSLSTLPRGGSLSTLPQGDGHATLPRAGSLTTLPPDGAAGQGASSAAARPWYRFDSGGSAPQRSFFREVVVPLAAAILGGLIVAAALLLAPGQRDQRQQIRYLRAELWSRQLALASDIAQRAFAAVEVLEAHGPAGDEPALHDASSELLLRQRMHEAQAALATLMPHARLVLPGESYHAVAEMHEALGSCDRDRALAAYKRLVARLREDLSAEQVLRQGPGGIQPHST